MLAVATDCAGLTLTCANHIFLLDPVLSPAVMAQLVGRISRQGQTRPCYVYNFVVDDSIEGAILHLRTRLASGVTSEGAAGAAEVDATARGAVGRTATVDANAASTSRLPLPEMLFLLQEGMP